MARALGRRHLGRGHRRPHIQQRLPLKAHGRREHARNDKQGEAVTARWLAEALPAFGAAS